MDLTLQLPESLDDITLDRYAKYSKIDFTDASQEFIDRTIMRIFYDIRSDLYKSFEMKDIRILVDAVFEVMEEKPPFVMVFKHRDKEWGFIPDLNAITYGEFVDLQDVSQDYAKMMSILYRPVTKRQGENYKIEKYSGYKDNEALLKDMPLSIVAGATGFFLDLWMDLLQNTLKFLREKDLKLISSKISQKSGDGIAQFLKLQEDLFSNLMRQPRLKSTKHLFS